MIETLTQVPFNQVGFDLLVNKTKPFLVRAAERAQAFVFSSSFLLKVFFHKFISCLCEL